VRVPTRRFSILSALRPSSLRIEPAAAHALVDAGALLIDVRRHDDDRPSPDGALRIPPDEIPAAIAEFRPEVPIVLGCT
jgi:rhodanese-related sulfurtransferase